jgi:hypothetical protein
MVGVRIENFWHSSDGGRNFSGCKRRYDYRELPAPIERALDVWLRNETGGCFGCPLD